MTFSSPDRIERPGTLDSDLSSDHSTDLSSDLSPRLAAELASSDLFRHGFTEAEKLAPDQRWSRYDEPGVLTGPEPVPDWVITDDGAIDTEFGILKSGKEADVFLVERSLSSTSAALRQAQEAQWVQAQEAQWAQAQEAQWAQNAQGSHDGPGAEVPVTPRSTVLAAKRYRPLDNRQFRRDTSYTESRRVRNSRDRRAIAKGTKHGRAVQSTQWAAAEFATLCDLWSIGVPVPYPIQLDGDEILMEFITTADGAGAPRLAQLRPDHDQLVNYWEQLYRAMAVLAGRQQTHGDLSAYNLLAEDDRLVIIDLPQVVDIVGNPHGMDFLARDCRNVCAWFTARGLELDADKVLAELISYAW